ncbi:hypothetical protein Hanom_Chr14g01250361 [Helianthus anomalus]
MFSTPITNSVNNLNGLTKEEEIGLKEKQRVMDLSVVNDAHKENYLKYYVKI